MSSSRFFGRKYKLTINGAGIDVSVEKLDIRFSVKFYQGSRFGDAEITIIGLKGDSFSKFEKLTIISPAELVRKEVVVTLDAGYGGEGKVERVFRGIVMSASISAPPELAVSIKCASVKARYFTSKKYNSEPETSCESIARSALAVFGVTFKNMTKNLGKDKLDAKVFNGDVFRFISIIESMAPWILVYDVDEDGNGYVTAYDRDDSKASVTIDQNNGLLGVNSTDCCSATVQTWLQFFPNLIGHPMRLKSKLHESASGMYRVYMTEYRGQYRGRDWYTQIYGIRMKEK